MSSEVLLACCVERANYPHREGYFRPVLLPSEFKTIPSVDQISGKHYIHLVERPALGRQRKHSFIFASLVWNAPNFARSLDWLSSQQRHNSNFCSARCKLAQIASDFQIQLESLKETLRDGCLTGVALLLLKIKCVRLWIWNCKIGPFWCAFPLWLKAGDPHLIFREAHYMYTSHWSWCECSCFSAVKTHVITETCVS